MEEKENIVTFYPYGEYYYYSYKGRSEEVQSFTLDKLKEELVLPYQVVFHRCPSTVIRQIIKKLYEKDVHVEGKMIENEYGIPNYLFTFSINRKSIDAIKVPNKKVLYGRENYINPYTIMTLDGKILLLEVTKDYAKQNEGEYYFLCSDLSKEERKAFSPCHVNLEYDFLVKMQEESLNNNKSRRLFKNKNDFFKTR